MRQVATILTGNRAQERRNASIASASSLSGQRSHIRHSSSGSFAEGSASGLVKKDSTGKTIHGIESRRGEGIAAAHMLSGFALFSVETWLLAVSVAQRMLNYTRTTSNRIRIFLICASRLITASRFVSSAIGHCILRKMKRRLIRWTPYQMMLGAIPSQARRETCLKV